MEQIIKDYIQTREEAARKIIANAKCKAINYGDVIDTIIALEWTHRIDAKELLDAAKKLLNEEMSNLEVD
jgi:hypothetical protein